MTNQELVLALLGTGALGAALSEVVRWLLKRFDRGETRQETVDKLGVALREEMRLDNLRLRERLDKTEEKYETRLKAAEERNAYLAGQVSSLRSELATARDENIALSSKSGREEQRLTEQAKTLADQGLKISTLENELVAARDEIALLRRVLDGHDLELPETKRRKTDTGPLRPATATGE